MILHRLARFVVHGAIVVFGLVGLLGVLTSWFEFTWLYPVAVDGDGVTVRNQQRFLKALELAWAFALYVQRDQVFVRDDVTRVVLFLFWVTPLSRLVSMGLDGWPHPHFVALVGVELAAAVVLSLRSVYAPNRRAARSSAS